MDTAFYFTPFEKRQPPPPLEWPSAIEFAWQMLASMNLVFGAWYVWWRWTSSLNYDALWFAVPLAAAETCAYFGLILFTINLWKVQDTPRQEPPCLIGECVAEPECYPARPLVVDIFFPTYNEAPELVRLSIRDAKRITYPHPISVLIHVLDDGHREQMRQIAEEEGVNYITRDSNIGFKAGNLANAMKETGGDFIVICDADTRPFPTLLDHTLGYFRDPEVAWVQTPQWFYDIPEGEPLPDAWRRRFGQAGRRTALFIEHLIGPVQLGRDPLVNDPKMFYDIIQRRRNWVNASFCCGAGSVHRREAVMYAALKTYAEEVDRSWRRQRKMERKLIDLVRKFSQEEQQDVSKRIAERLQQAWSTKVTPYKFHVSEDFYTSIILHSDRERQWKSVLHPEVESKMLSPQDLHSWIVQRFKYAGGTLDIMLRKRGIFQPGLSLGQRLMYGATFWSYLGGIWNFIFLLAPAVYLFTGISPVCAYNFDFYKHIMPFLLLTLLAVMTGTWGISGFKDKSSYIAFFSVNLRALWTVLRGRTIKFPVTPKQRQEGNFFHLILPQFGMILLTLVGNIYAWTMHLNGGASLTGQNYAVSGLVFNTFWGTHNIISLNTMISAAFWKPKP